MKAKKIVQELETAAKTLGIALRKGKGSFRGGLCTISGRETIVLNKLHLPEIHVTILAESLKAYDLSELSLKPAVRKALEDAWASQEAMVAEDVGAADLRAADVEPA